MSEYSFDFEKLDKKANELSMLLIKKFGNRKPLCYLHSFGCQQNVSDGEKILGMLYKAGFYKTDSLDNADLIIFNTCAVRENAEEKVFSLVGELKHIKEKRPDVIIGLCGCMAQESHVVERIRKTYRQIDLVFGTFSYFELYDMLCELILKDKRIFNQSGDESLIFDCVEQIRDNKFSASVPIMSGCNNFCTYCIVPYVRGREKSRNPESVLEEVRDLISKGYKEIMLLGQNVNSYSYDFPKLLRDIDNIDGDFRIRFMSSHPKDATNELIDTILNSKKICKHLHLPLQAGSNRILELMNRRYTVEKYLEIINYARDKCSDFSFSTDIIVGFPSETYDEFLETVRVIEKIKFDNIYTFVYSKRSGTKAALMEDNISEKEKGLWLRELLLKQRDVSDIWMSRFVGRTQKVLIDTVKDEEKGILTGKNDENIIVEVQGDKSLLGEFVNVKIIKAMNWALLGVINN